MLVVMTGLPCTGKSTVAAEAARLLGAPIYSVDPLEAVLLRGGVDREHRSDYLAYDLAAMLTEEQLQRGLPAVVDAVNALEHLRAWFLGLAEKHQQPGALIETVCSDRDLHRRMVENRDRGIRGYHYEPTWADIEARAEEYENPVGEHLVLDAADPLDQTLRSAERYILDRTRQRHEPPTP